MQPYNTTYQSPTQASSAAPAQPWIDYQPAEAALFGAIKPELQLLAQDHAYQFGADVVDMVDDVAAAAYTKATNILHTQGTRRAFGDKHLLALLTRWAAWWCEHFAALTRSKAAQADVCALSAADRRAYNLAKYGGPDAVKVGQARGLRKRQASARQHARRCVTLRRCSWTMARIAQALNISAKTVQRALKKHTERLKLLGYAVLNIDWTFGKDSLVRTSLKEVASTRQQPLPNVHTPHETPPAAQCVEITASDSGSLLEIEPDEEANARILSDLAALYPQYVAALQIPPPITPETASTAAGG